MCSQPEAGGGASRERTALHEAGHVVAGYVAGLRLIDSDIAADAEGGHGHTNFEPSGRWFRAELGRSPDDPSGRRHRAYIDAVVTTFLAGAAAESRGGDALDLDGSGFDLEDAVRTWLRASRDDDRAVRQQLDRLGRRARRLMERPDIWSGVEAVAAALLRDGRLSGQAAAELLRPLLGPPGQL